MWTPQMSADYWAEVAREVRGDEKRSMGCADPFTLTIQSRLEAEFAPPAPPDPELQRVWNDCLDWLPAIEGQALRLAYAESLGGKPAGRAGQGSAIARSLNLEQSTFVCMLDRAESRVEALAPLCRAGHSVQAVCRRVDQQPLRGAVVSHSDLVRAYGQTWSTAGAGRLLGMAQSAVHSRVVRLAQSEPVLQVLRAARKLG
jgi:hypothetical protein